MLLNSNTDTPENPLNTASNHLFLTLPHPSQLPERRPVRGAQSTPHPPAINKRGIPSGSSQNKGWD